MICRKSFLPDPWNVFADKPKTTKEFPQVQDLAVIQKEWRFLQTISPSWNYAVSTGYQLTQNFILYSDIVKHYGHSDDL
jgi:hypothetical protein